MSQLSLDGRLVFGRSIENANVATLCAFTGYGRAYIEAIAENMVNNQLWKGDQYTASGWLWGACLDEDEFGQQIEAGLGSLWYSDEAADSGKTRDVVMMDPAL